LLTIEQEKRSFHIKIPLLFIIIIIPWIIQSTFFTMELQLSSSAVIQVIQSWEIARQQHGFQEQLGIDTLML